MRQQNDRLLLCSVGRSIFLQPIVVFLRRKVLMMSIHAIVGRFLFVFNVFGPMSLNWLQGMPVWAT
jgi:hypothetical protein